MGVLPETRLTDWNCWPPFPAVPYAVPGTIQSQSVKRYFPINPNVSGAQWLGLRGAALLSFCDR